jgi:hypothetical protein
MVSVNTVPVFRPGSGVGVLRVTIATIPAPIAPARKKKMAPPTNLAAKVAETIRPSKPIG